MNAILTILEIAGSLGLFLYGMKILSDGLQKSAGNKMKSILHMMTSNRLFAVLTGLLITMIIQSSSATTVMVVSFVNASLMNLTQAIGVILGANIGTTVTGWIVAILGFSMDITVLALCAIAIALPMMFSNKIKLKDISEIFLGFGLLFMGLEFLQSSMPDIGEHQEVLQFLSRFEDGRLSSAIICVIIGTIMTMIVQSSSATMAITITMAYQGWIGVYTACALCLGQNIGTTITAYLASIGASTAARRASWAHILFNVTGSVLAIIFFNPLLNLVNAITPGDIYSMQGEALRETLPAFLAMYHTVFNVINTLLFFPFIPQYSALINRLIKDKKVYNEDDYHFEYISNNYMDTPEIYLVTVRGEIKKMAELTDKMFSEYADNYNRNNIDIEQLVAKLKKQEDYADQMQEQLTSFCVKLQQDSQTPTNAETITMFLRVIDELESITDSIFNLIKLAEQRVKQNLAYDEQMELELKSLIDLVHQFLTFINTHSESGISMDDLEYANMLERSIDQQHENLVAKIHSRLGSGNIEVPLQLMMLEVERNLEHIGDYCINIAECYHSVKKHVVSQVKTVEVNK